MIDKAVTIKKDKVTVILGQIEQHTLTHVERSLAVFLGIV
jgi:hypothetical protein